MAGESRIEVVREHPPRMSGNVTPGEIMELRLAIWDTSGRIFHSLVLLDDCQWSLDAATPGVAPG